VWQIQEGLSSGGLGAVPHPFYLSSLNLPPPPPLLADLMRPTEIRSAKEPPQHLHMLSRQKWASSLTEEAKWRRSVPSMIDPWWPASSVLAVNLLASSSAGSASKLVYGSGGLLLLCPPRQAHVGCLGRCCTHPPPAHTRRYTKDIVDLYEETPRSGEIYALSLSLSPLALAPYISHSPCRSGVEASQFVCGMLRSKGGRGIHNAYTGRHGGNVHHHRWRRP
jgi:hypothetical protein